MNRGKKYIEAGNRRMQKNPVDISMSMGELRSLISTAKEHNNIIPAIWDAFSMGVEAGARMVEREYKKEGVNHGK